MKRTPKRRTRTTMATSTKRTVFITNYSAHDYSDATKYGELKPITTGSLNLMNVDRLITAAVEQTDESTPEDYLLISGPPLMCALAQAVWMQRHGKCKILIYDAKEREYVMKLVTNEQINLAIEHLGAT